MRPSKRLFAVIAAAVAVLGAGVALSQTPAQAYAAKAVRIIIGLPHGGTPDMLARGLSQELTRMWGQPVIVENRVGVGDILAATAVAKDMPECNGRIGVTGFCIGGNTAFLGVARYGADAAVSYYGTRIRTFLGARWTTSRSPSSCTSSNTIRPTPTRSATGSSKR